MLTCRLCQSSNVVLKAQLRYGDYQECLDCHYVQQVGEQLPSLNEEERLYLLHENHIENQGYVGFLTRFLNAINFEGVTSVLDYGCGPEPVLSQILEKQGVASDYYDPIFFPRSLNSTYDLITCCEVIEHFHQPRQEIGKLVKQLNPGGRLAFRTEMVPADFENWHYPRDPTHVGFFSKPSVEYLAREFSLELNLWAPPVFILKLADG